MHASGVSVIIPTWNRADCLERCLLSLFAQDFPSSSFEIVVVDDGSNDETWAIVKKCSEGRELPPLRYVKQPHLGMVPARLNGVSVARGELLAFIDDDAEAPPHWLSELVRWAQVEGVGIVGGPVYPLPARELEARIDDRGFHRWSTFHCRPSESFTDVDFVPGGNMAIWRHALDLAGSFDPAFDGVAWREESDLCVRVRRAGLRIGLVGDAPIEHASAKWKRGLRVRPAAQFSLAKNNGYFVGKHFRGPRVTYCWLVAQPLRELIPIALDLGGALGALALWPVRWVGTAYGLVLARRASRESDQRPLAKHDFMKDREDALSSDSPAADPFVQSF